MEGREMEGRVKEMAKSCAEKAVDALGQSVAVKLQGGRLVG